MSVSTARPSIWWKAKEFGNVQGFEIVVGRFNFGAFDDGEADGNEDVFDFLEDLADQVMGADGADYAGEGEVHPLARQRRFFRAGLDGETPGFDLRLGVGAHCVQRHADGALQLWSGRPEPVVRNERERAGFAAQPAVAEEFPI